jgi:hypothetical protein
MMNAVKLDEVAEGRAVDQSRREALKRFGRYAAAAPTAMVLLQPRDGHAGSKGRGRSKGSNGRKRARRRGGGESPY